MERGEVNDGARRPRLLNSGSHLEFCPYNSSGQPSRRRFIAGHDDRDQCVNFQFTSIRHFPLYTFLPIYLPTYLPTYQSLPLAVLVMSFKIQKAF